MTQNERILARLNAGPLCSLEPLDWEPRITRTAARIQDLRDLGHDIESVACRRHDHKTAQHVAYHIVEPDQMELFG